MLAIILVLTRFSVCVCGCVSLSLSLCVCVCVYVCVRTCVFLHTQRKPGPVFNWVTALAYSHGATYLYRINDDSEFATKWANAFVTQLQSWGMQCGCSSCDCMLLMMVMCVLTMMTGPPYGSIGPRCDEGNSGMRVTRAACRRMCAAAHTRAVCVNHVCSDLDA